MVLALLMSLGAPQAFAGDMHCPIAGQTQTPGITGDIGFPGITGDIGTPGITGEIGMPGVTGDIEFPGIAGHMWAGISAAIASLFG